MFLLPRPQLGEISKIIFCVGIYRAVNVLSVLDRADELVIIPAITCQSIHDPKF